MSYQLSSANSVVSILNDSRNNPNGEQYHNAFMQIHIASTCHKSSDSMRIKPKGLVCIPEDIAAQLIHEGWGESKQHLQYPIFATNYKLSSIRHGNSARSNTTSVTI